ncbi:MAG TPA: tRNA adenosine(34) deaminase TadA [Phycisphaerales bacterium]|nr:tRNA adenosine(34) deaminase TadA [Phycisphaerales bacterium]
MAELRLAQRLPHGVSETDVQMMQRAISLAHKAAAIGEVPVGAVIYRGSKIIAEAYNLRESTKDPVGHAELVAISKAGKVLGDWRLTGCSLAVTLEPCPMCAGALVNSRVERVIYGCTDPKAGACHTLYKITNDKRLNHEAEVIGGVLAPQCKALLKGFFQERREINKTRKAAAG